MTCVFYLVLSNLGTPRRRFAGAERGSYDWQAAVNLRCERVRDTEHASRCWCRLLECSQGNAEIVERGAGVKINRLRVIPSQSESF